MEEEDDDLTIEGLKCFDSDSDAPSDGGAPLSAGSAGSAAPSDEPSDDASDGGGGPRRRHPSQEEIVIDGDGHPELPVREHPRKLTPASHRQFAFPVLLHPSRAPSRGRVMERAASEDHACVHVPRRRRAGGDDVAALVV